jgi:hypothetical protein
MANGLRDLVAKLRLDTAEFARGLRGVTQPLKAVGSEFDRTGASARRAGAEIAATVRGAASFGRNFLAGLAAGATAAVFAAVTTGARTAVASLADLKDSADKVGLATGTFQALQFGMQQSGVSAAEFSAGMEKLTENIGDAARGEGKFGELLARNGIALKDSQGQIRATTDILADFADLIQRTPDEAARMSLVTDAFGRGGKAMVLALAGGSAGLRDMQAAARASGVVLNDAVIRRAAELDDKFEVLSVNVSNFFKSMAVDAAAAGYAISQALGLAADDPDKLAGPMRDLVNLTLQTAETFGVLAENVRRAGFEKTAELLEAQAKSLQLQAKAAEDGRKSFDELSASLEATTDLAGDAVGALAAINGVSLGFVVGEIGRLIGALDTLTYKARLAANLPPVRRSGPVNAPPVPPRDDRGISPDMADYYSQIYGKGMSGRGIPSPSYGLPVVETGDDSGGSSGSAGSGGLSEMQREAARWFTETRTEAEKYAAEISELDELLAKGEITQDTYNRAVAQTKEKLETATTAMAEFKDVSKTAFTEFVTGAKSLREAVAQLATSLAQMFAGKAFDGIWSALIGAGAGLFAKGGVFAGGRVQAFADGGVVSGMTAFALQGGIGVMGEAGPEAIMPLSRGADGRLGVQALGGGGDFNVTITMDKSTGAMGAFVTDTAGRVVARAAPAIMTGAVQQAVGLNREEKIF